MAAPRDLQQAASRFYRTFFKWSQLSARITPRQCSYTPPRRLLSTSSARLDLRPEPRGSRNDEAARVALASSHVTLSNHTKARVVLTPERVAELKKENVLEELRRFTACNYELRERSNGSTTLELSGSLGNVQIACQLIAQRLRADGVAVKWTDQLSGIGTDWASGAPTEAPAVPQYEGSKDDVREWDATDDVDQDEDLDLPVRKTKQSTVWRLGQDTLPERSDRGPREDKQESEMRAWEIRAWEVTTILDVPARIAVLFPLEEALPQGTAVDSDLSSMKLRRNRVAKALRIRGDKRSEMRSLRISGHIYGVRRMVKTLSQTRLSSVATPDPEESLGKTELAEPVRYLMRSIVNPVAVVTTRHFKSRHTNDQPFTGCHGSTVSSLTSVALQPVPVVSFNLLKSGSTAQMLQASGVCDIHILAPDGGGKRIAAEFASNKSGDLSLPFRRVHGMVSSAVSLGAFGTIEIKSPGVVAHLRCRVFREKTVTIGDHQVIFCAVSEVRLYTGDSDAAWADINAPLGRTCLAYADGSYGILAPLPETTPERAQHDSSIVSDNLHPGQVIAAGDAETEPTPVEKTEECVSTSKGFKLESSASVVEAAAQTAQTHETPSKQDTHNGTPVLDNSALQTIIAEAYAQSIPEPPTSYAHQANPSDTLPAKRHYSTTAKHGSRNHRPSTRRSKDSLFVDAAEGYKQRFPTDEREDDWEDDAYHYSPSPSPYKRGAEEARNSVLDEDVLDAEHPPAETHGMDPDSPGFLRQTVADYLSYDSYDRGNFVLKRWIRVLWDFGPERVRLAMDGHDVAGTHPGSVSNPDDILIRGLVEKAHRAHVEGRITTGLMARLIRDEADVAKPGRRRG